MRGRATPQEQSKQWGDKDVNERSQSGSSENEEEGSRARREEMWARVKRDAEIRYFSIPQQRKAIALCLLVILF
jgi:hypothetical protein